MNRNRAKVKIEDVLERMKSLSERAAAIVAFVKAAANTDSASDNPKDTNDGKSQNVPPPDNPSLEP